jgi:hypothetical protein
MYKFKLKKNHIVWIIILFHSWNMKHWVVLLLTCYGSTSKFENLKKKNIPLIFFNLCFFVQVLTQ